MKTLYLDLFSGISGDMFLGAMLDLGLDESYLREQLALLDVGDYELRIHRSSRSSVEGVKFDVLLNAPQNPSDQNVSSHGGHSHSHGGMEDHGHDTEHARDFAQIKELIRSSALSLWVQEKAESVFHRIAVAEGKVHGLPPDEVHFHEVGAVDSIVDILGACIALESMGKPQVRASVVVEGTGFVHCAHGKFPVPTMATLSILGEAGIALTQCDLPYELVTPTGAALLAEFSQSFGLMKGLVAEKVGYGLGGRDIPGRPNVLRAVLGCVPR
ncbi:MAG: LarC family nickel insertion protein [Limisphaerales bacterium]